MTRQRSRKHSALRRATLQNKRKAILPRQRTRCILQELRALCLCRLGVKYHACAVQPDNRRSHGVSSSRWNPLRQNARRETRISSAPKVKTIAAPEGKSHQKERNKPTTPPMSAI